MSKRTYIIVGIVGTFVLLTLADFAHWTARGEAMTYESFLAMLKAQEFESLAQPKDFKTCLVATPSCMALDERPFVTCPAADKQSCGRIPEFYLLGPGRRVTQ